MAELQLKSHRFREEREADWRRLERLLTKVEGRSPGKLTAPELLEIPVLYRQALSSLSVARAITLDQGLIDYLESLCARAYFIVYGPRTSVWERTGRFFSHDWPAAVRGLWRETLAATLIGVLGLIVAMALIHQDAGWYFSFVPKALAGGRDPSASAEFLRSTLFAAPKGQQHSGLSVMAAFLFTHNAGIALLAFALGFAFCVPTGALMAYNGAMLGAFLSLFISRGLGVEAGGWLFIHGVTELFAVTLAGAAGFAIGTATLFPGDRPRAEAVAQAGRRAAAVMTGVVVMLFVAGLLEGFARQLIQNTAVRYGVATLSAAVWGLYFYGPRRRGGLGHE
ncbi:stage II sporulation protein M [Phenylobacterium aquaticum]|uniref:stage II sporulation protein M n=1 Tax=Phenylobacterium aquaticum TaxID=1763816 RepID=UPI001F5C9316|nr:stage II sporulation protein M [Phenylobacterium aquaticum]MCI3134887.1 stage II sporulation protein M [Phenylobacterium aquaticum]